MTARLNRTDPNKRYYTEWFGPATFRLRSEEAIPGSVLYMSQEARLAARNAELDRFIAERKTSIYVQVLADSLSVGNCEDYTMEFARQMWQQIDATGEAAVRADLVLAARNDSYTLRATRAAALRLSHAA